MSLNEIFLTPKMLVHLSQALAIINLLKHSHMLTHTDENWQDPLPARKLLGHNNIEVLSIIIALSLLRDIFKNA